MVNSDRWDLTGTFKRGDTWRDPVVQTFTIDGPDHGTEEAYFRATTLLALGALSSDLGQPWASC